MATSDAVRKFMAAVNKNYGGEVLAEGGKFKALNMARFSSGILSLDLALGGGWPFSRIALLAGMESTGKTLIATKACVGVEQYDHITKRHISTFAEDDAFYPGTALFVDSEGSFDLEWAVANGFNADHHVVARPQYSQQAIDIVSGAIEENLFDLILLDSIACMVPMEELEASSEDWQMGLAARLNNKAFRRWGGHLNKVSQGGRLGPCVICINQFRMNIGVVIGDPRVLPGGMQQKFNAAIIIYTKSGKYDEKPDSKKEMSSVKLSGVCHKNKTYIPKQNFSYDLSLKTTKDFTVGHIDNVKQLMDKGKKYGLIKAKGGKTVFGDDEFDTQRDLAARLSVSERLYGKLWRSILKAGIK